MSDVLRVVAFDVDRVSLESLRQAFPDSRVEAVSGATLESLDRDWNPRTANLLVIGARDGMAETLGLCRGLRSQVGRLHTPLLVLVQPAQEALVRAALDASASSCLILPIHPKELVTMVKRALADNQPGRHTLGLDQAQREDPWQDDGGEA
jgi:DNA-binding response OmpR family regulator